jgi:hypothetical protein
VRPPTHFCMVHLFNGPVLWKPSLFWVCTVLIHHKLLQSRYSRNHNKSLSTMRQTILALAGASSLLFGASSAAVLIVNDGTRALKRADDMKDTTPMTFEEGNRLRSLMESGRLHVHRQGELESLPEVKVQNSLRSRVLGGKHPSHSSPRSNPTTRAAQKPRSHANTAGRKAPQPQPRQQGDE